MAYTFNKTQEGNIEILQDGKRISTGTVDYAKQLGYQPPTPITTNNLAPVVPITIPPKATLPNPGITPISNLPEVPTTATTTTAKTEETKTPSPATNWTDRLKETFGLAPKPTEVSPLYEEAVKSADMEAKRKADTDAQLAVSSAQAELQGIQAQIQGVIDKRDVANLTLEKDSANRGIVGTVLSRQQTEINRQSAIEALPLQAMALAAQAKVAGLQGQAQYAQSALANAQKKLDTAFALKKEDADNDFNYKKDLFDKMWTVANDAQKTELKKAETQATRDYEYGQKLEERKNDLGKLALESGQGDLLSEIGQVKTDAELYQIMGRIKPNTTKTQIEKQQLQNAILQGEKLRLENAKTGEGLTPEMKKDQITAYAQQTASTGKLPSALDLKQAGITAGDVSIAAKELPKETGTMVDKNTGIKSSKISATLENAYGTLYSVVDLAKKLKELDNLRIGGIIAGTLGKVFGSEQQQRYIDLRDQISDLLARARTGAAINATEEARYFDMLPGRVSEPFGVGINSDVKIQNFIDNISTDLQNKLNTGGLSIYGFSTVDVGGKKYKVGDIIQNSQGQQGRVNPDGSITQL